MDEPMKEALVAFLQEPSRERFLNLRDLVAACPSYEPYSPEMGDLHECCEREHFAELKKKAQRMMPNWLLCPAVHMYLSIAEMKLGNRKSAEMEAFIYHRCIEGILSTGDGTRQQPYAVMRTEDEYDVLAHFKKKVASQALVHEGGRHLDKFTTDDGSEMWFDVTVPFEHMTRRMGAGGIPL